MIRHKRALGIAGALLAVCAGAAFISLHAAERSAPPPVVLPPLPDAQSIRDDPTVAPDPKQSADNNISLPTDI
jgi:hypothetical protein